MTPEDRAKLIMNALGWQGGTIHQACKEIGCEVQDFLYAKPQEAPIGSPYSRGWFAARTSPHYLKVRALHEEQGNVQFWLGVAAGERFTQEMGNG